jgi:glycosyltransferase involved in cell wall biosynthesis/O-antigen/teichoic acid export membrane protein
VASLGPRTASGALWSGASYTAARVLVFVGVAVIARLLRPDDYGLFAMAALGISLLEGSYDFGLRRGLIYFGGSDDVSMLLQTGFALTLSLGLAISALMFVLTPLVASVFGDPRVIDLIHVLSAYNAIACLGVVPDALLQHRLAFDRRFWPTVAGPAGRYLIAIPLAAMGFGAWSLVWGQLIGICLEVVLLFVLARWRPRLGWSRAAALRLVKYSSQVSVVEWLGVIALNLDYVFVGHFLGSAVLGIYTLAFKLPDTSIGAAGWISSRVLLPAFVELEERKQSVAIGLLQALHLLAIIVVPLSAGLYLLAPWIVPVLFGEQWIDAVPVVQLLAVWACLSGLLQGVGAAFMAAGQPRKIIYAQAVWLLVLVPGLYLAAQRSIVLVAAVQVAGMLVYALVKLALVPSTLGLRALDVGRAVTTGVLLAAMIVLTLVPVLHLIERSPAPSVLATALATGALSYVGGVWLLDRSLARRMWKHVTRERQPNPMEIRPEDASRSLNVWMFVQSFFPRIGGAEANLLALLGPLGEAGVDVHIVTRRFPGMAAAERIAGTPVCRLPVPGNQVRASLTFMLAALWLVVRARPRPDVLHAHELRSPTQAAILIKCILRRPIVAHVLRGGVLGDVAVLRAAPLGRLRLRLFAHAVDQFIAVSEETRSELVTAGVPPDRVALVRYGVDTSRFCPAAPAQRAQLRQCLGFEGWQVVLVVARLVPEKGFDRLLAAWPAVKACVPAALLIVIGDGCERGSLSRQAGCLPDVRFLGELHDPVPYMQAADCFTLPSFTEGQPISLLEAMSVGLPCVATAIGGIAEVLENGRTGVLVPPGDVPRLGDALIHTLHMDQRIRIDRAEASRRRVLQHHSIEANAEALRRLYDQLT